MSISNHLQLNATYHCASSRSIQNGHPLATCPFLSLQDLECPGISVPGTLTSKALRFEIKNKRAWHATERLATYVASIEAAPQTHCPSRALSLGCWVSGLAILFYESGFAKPFCMN